MESIKFSRFPDGGKITSLFVSLLMLSSFGLSVYADTLLYDANGNLIQGEGKCFVYDGGNRLRSVTDCGSNVLAEYSYDHTGRRVLKVEHSPQGDISTYYFSGDYEEVHYPNGTVKKITYFRANGELVGRKEVVNGVEHMYFVHGDHLGSTSVVTDSSGNKVEEVHYYPFGSMRTELSDTDSKYLFTGQELDSETGLYYYKSRYYNPGTGRFAQPDTIIPDVYDPQSLNRYSYVENNPVKYVDEEGNIPLLATAAIGAAVGGVVGFGVSAAVQYVNTGAVDLGEAGKAAAVGAVSGGVAGLTLGAGTVALGGAGLTGSAALAGEGAVVAGSGVAAGQAGLATSNVLEGRPMTEGLGDPGYMATDAAVSVATWGVLKGISVKSSIGSSTAGNPSSKPVHGNSLKCDKPTVGYSLREKSNQLVAKYGETTKSKSVNRYSSRFYRDEAVYMQVEAHGTKAEMHAWQHQKILEHKKIYGRRPRLNKNDY